MYLKNLMQNHGISVNHQTKSLQAFILTNQIKQLVCVSKKDGLIDVHISETIYEVPQYKVELINSVYLKPKPSEDEYGNQFKEYSYEFTYDRTVNINLAVQGIKSALKKFDETQAKYVKSVN